MVVHSRDRLRELFGGHPRVGGGHDLRIAFSPWASAPLTSPASSVLNGSFVFHSGCCGAERLHPVESKGHLEVEGLLGPERAVVVEDGDPLGRRHEGGRALFRDVADELHDGLLGGASFQEGRASVCAGAAPRRGEDDRESGQ